MSTLIWIMAVLIADRSYIIMSEYGDGALHTNCIVCRCILPSGTALMMARLIMLMAKSGYKQVITRSIMVNGAD